MANKQVGEWGRGGQGEWAQGQALADFLHHPRTLALTPSEMGSIEDFEERRDRSAVVSNRPKETRGVGGSCDVSGRGVSTAATRAVAAAAWTGSFVLVTPCRGNGRLSGKTGSGVRASHRSLPTCRRREKAEKPTECSGGVLPCCGFPPLVLGSAPGAQRKAFPHVRSNT